MRRNIYPTLTAFLHWHVWGCLESSPLAHTSSWSASPAATLKATVLMGSLSPLSYNLKNRSARLPCSRHSCSQAAPNSNAWCWGRLGSAIFRPGSALPLVSSLCRQPWGAPWTILISRISFQYHVNSCVVNSCVVLGPLALSILNFFLLDKASIWIKKKGQVNY